MIACAGDPPHPPHTSSLQPSSLFGCLTLIIFVPLQPARENFVTHPSTSSRSAACRHGNSEQGSEMAFHFGGEAHPPPARPLSPSFCSLPLVSSPTFAGQKAFYYARTAAGPGELPLLSGQYSLVAPDRYLAATYRRRLALLAQMALCGACLFPCALLEAVPVASRRSAADRLYVPPPPRNPSPAPVVSLCESRWLQPSEKCLEFAIPGLRASSCLGFFFFSPSSPLVWYLQLLCL